MIEQAAHWAALLDGQEATEEVRSACSAWCAEHPLHRTAFDRIAGIEARFDALDLAQRRALASGLRPANGRRGIAGGLACLALIVGIGWMASRTMMLRALWPDHVTAVGEQQTLALADGSRLIADTGTRFDGYGTRGERKVMLFDGQVLARVAPDPARPFVVETREGRATALGTVYAVRRDGGRTIVTVIESRVEICPVRADCRTLLAGQSAAMTADGIGAIKTVDPEAAMLWTSGWIEVHDMPVSQIVKELQRYRSAPIQCDPARLSRVRVTGSFPLSRPDQALRSIAGATGLNVVTGADGSMALEPR